MVQFMIALSLLVPQHVDVSACGLSYETNYLSREAPIAVFNLQYDHVNIFHASSLIGKDKDLGINAITTGARIGLFNDTIRLYIGIGISDNRMPNNLEEWQYPMQDKSNPVAHTSIQMDISDKHRFFWGFDQVMSMDSAWRAAVMSVSYRVK